MENIHRCFRMLSGVLAFSLGGVMAQRGFTERLTHHGRP